MTKENKIIKDLKERNEKLVNQYRNRDIRCVSLERQLDKLKEENQKYKEVFDKINVFLDNHDKNAGKLYYKYDNKYLLSEIKGDIRDILKEVE